MDFVKGMIVGTAMVAGVTFLYGEINNNSKKKMMKKGKQFVKKMGMM